MGVTVQMLLAAGSRPSSRWLCSEPGGVSVSRARRELVQGQAPVVPEAKALAVARVKRGLCQKPPEELCKKAKVMIPPLERD